jgi:ligand-binding sensor domain-containing protein/signal transduction histidine kinase
MFLLKGDAVKRVAATIVLLMLLHTKCAIALDPHSAELNYTRRVWEVQDGLPEDVVRAFAQTPDRYLWIGTSAGLVRFDGTQFSVYDRHNVPQLKESGILSLLTDRDGGLWIGTEGGGLVLYRNQVFHLFSAPEGLTNGFVRSVEEDDRGRIWVGTDGGLFRIAGDRVERLDGTGGTQPVAVHSMFKDAAGRMWVGGTRVLRFDHDHVSEFQLRGEISQLRVKSMLVTSDGTSWVGTVSGLYRLDSQGADLGKPFERVKGIFSTVGALRQDSRGSVWVGTIGEGLYILHGGEYTHLRTPEWLPSNTVLGFFADYEKNMWVGTRHGMLRLSRTSVGLIPLPEAADSDFGTLYQDANKDLWMASNKLFRIRRGAARQYVFPELGGALVRNVFRDRAGGLWIGTDGTGVFRIFRGHVAHFTTRDGLANNYIRAFLQSKDGSIWIATDFGISQWSKGVFVSYQTRDGLVYSNVRTLFEDRNGDIWIGTEQGLSHMRGGLFLSDDLTMQLKDEKVWSIDQDRQGALWFGTRTDGLYRSKFGKVTHFTTKEGLVSDSIFQVVADKDDRLWMSGPEGVSTVKCAELDLTAGDLSHRLAVKLYGISQGNEMTQIYGGTQAASVLADDGIWFPTASGPVYVSAANYLQEEVPPVAIDRVVVDGQEQSPSANMVLSSGTKKIQFNYSAASLRSPEDIRFRYKLEGFDQSWMDSADQRQVYYTNLSPGHYRFRVTAFNMDDPAKMSETSLAIQQAPHFYRASWFVLTCLVGIATMIWIAHLRRVRELRLRFDAVLAERNRVAREMHDTLIQGCAGVSTILEGISSQTDGASEEQSSLLNYARMQLRMTLDDARRALWNLRKDESQTTKIGPLLISLADEVATEAGAAIFCETVGQQYSIQTGQARELVMVVREALFNAVHHSGPSTISLKIAFGQDSMDIEVDDDGRGFDQSVVGRQEQMHYGLIGMRERVERMSGSFFLSTYPGQGTQVRLRIPCKPMRPSKPKVAP